MMDNKDTVERNILENRLDYGGEDEKSNASVIVENDINSLEPKPEMTEQTIHVPQTTVTVTDVTDSTQANKINRSVLLDSDEKYDNEEVQHSEVYIAVKTDLAEECAFTENMRKDDINIVGTDEENRPAKRPKFSEEVELPEVEDENRQTDQNLETFPVVDLNLESRKGEATRSTISSEEATSESSHLLQSQFKNVPRQLTGSWESFKSDSINNFLKGCKWAPDGTCILTNSNDNKLRLYNLPQELYFTGGEQKVIPEMMPVLTMKEADTIYDYSWFPLMSSQQPDTACLAVTSKDTPIHLYDAFSGDLRCSYRAYNQVDEVVAAHCIEFGTDGRKLYCGFNKMIRVFDVTRPGREFQERPTFAKEGQRGIISCIAPSPTEDGLYAAGSYAKSIGLYNEPAGEMVCMFEGQQGGVTQIKFSNDGTKLYSGGRKDNEILCWDLRSPGQILFTLQRSVLTNQRMYFDITRDGRYIVSGSHDGSVIVWDSTTTPAVDTVHTDPVVQPTLRIQAHYDTTNGISLHPLLPLLATSSGQRHYNTQYESDDEDGNQPTTYDNSLRIWWT